MLLRFGVLAISSFLPLSFPDVWRQVITLGISMRYWSRWALETGIHHPLLPAVLDSGDTQGIMPMEFPILNLITAPCFALGPHLGRGCAILLYNFLMFSLVLLNAKIWKGKKIVGIEPFSAMLLLPLFSIGLHWSGKYMPDFVSVLLLCIATGLSWTDNRPRRSFVAATLGMLMKPTSIIVLALFLAHQRKTRKALQVSLWVIPATIFTVLYYTKGINIISQYQELPDSIGIHPRDFYSGLIAFFQHIPFVLKFYFEKAFFLGGIVLVLGITIWSKWIRKTKFPGILWLISILQFLAITLIDGGILFYDHYYYLLGLGPVLCLLFVDALQKVEHDNERTGFLQGRFLYGVLGLGILIPILEVSSIDLKTTTHRVQEPIWSIDQQVRDLQSRNPTLPWRQGKAFRSSIEPFPMLGLYFGEIQGSKQAEYGFFYKEEGLPFGCKEIDQTILIQLAECR